MASNYNKVFNNPYPNGWKNLPSTNTPIIAQALQQHTNAIVNIENFLYENAIPTKTSDLINDAIKIPDKLSDFNNDVGYITDAEVPTKVSELQNDLGFVTEVELPQNLSDFNNDMNFINNTVNNLLNYFLKDEVFNKEQVLSLLSNLKNWDVCVVNTLPTENISETTVYCVPKNTEGIVLATDYNLDLEGSIDDTSVPSLNLGNSVIMPEFVEHPYD